MKCRICEKEKLNIEFYFRKDTGKYRSDCNDCRHLRAKKNHLKNKDENNKKMRENYYENREERLKKVSEYQRNNKDKIKEQSVKYRINNKDKVAISKKKYVQNNSEKVAAYQKKYRDEHREELREKTRIHRKKRRQEDPSYRVLQNLRKRIYDALNGKCKSARSIQLLGCSIEEYRSYLELKFKPEMSWNNYGRGGWNIDHVRPCDSFDLIDPKQQEECFHYSNTQPLWEHENLLKGNKF